MNAGEVLVTLAAVVGVSVACAGATYSCVAVNDRYYKGMEACLNSGGSWVPNSQGGYSSSCINPHARQ